MTRTKTANAIALSAALAFSFAPFAFQRLPVVSGIAYPVTGISLLALTGKGKRNETDQAEQPWQYDMGGLESVAGGVIDVVVNLQRQGAKGGRKMAVTYDVLVLPQALSKAEDNAAIAQAFKDIHRRSFLAIANTGGGKTWFLHQSAAWAIEQGEHVIICDRSYGKRGQHWFGLPVYDLSSGTHGVVFEGSPDDLEACVEMFFQERERRAKETKAAAKAARDTPVFKRWALYLPEKTESLIEYRDKYGDEAADTLSKKLNSLLRDGHGYNVFLRSDAQSAATGEVEVSEGMRKNLHWVFFGDAVETKELGKVGLTKEWVAKVEKARKEHGKYLGLALIEGKPHFIKAPNHEYDFSDAISIEQAAALWIEGHQQDILETIKDRIDGEHPVSPTAMFEFYKSYFPSGYCNKGKENPYWQAFKTFVEFQEG